MSVESLRAEVLKMSFIERLTFIQFIVDSIKDETVDNHHFELSDEWKEELDRRSEAYRSGKAKTVTWEEIKENIRTRNPK